jgi:hypothetical protein
MPEAASCHEKIAELWAQLSALVSTANAPTFCLLMEALREAYFDEVQDARIAALNAMLDDIRAAHSLEKATTPLRFRD